jgi:hypothetical protein
VSIVQSRHPLLHQVREGARWVGQDAYPAWPVVADEHERWLEFVDAKRELPRFMPRLRDRAGQRDDALAEISVGYFLERHCGLSIVGWEPPAANGKTGEYLVRLPDRRDMFVEVKARGWEDEIVLTEGPRSPRLLLSKYIQAEARATAPWRSIREAVKKAYPKMQDTLPTLLVINDDLFVALNNWPLNAEIALYCPRGAGNHPDGYLAENGCFVRHTHERLGAVGVLNVDFPCGAPHARFRFRLYDNPHCLSAVAVPNTVFSGHPRHP